MAGGSNRYRAALVRHQLTPGLISSLPGTDGLPPFISFSTSYPELDFAALRPNCGRSLENGLRFYGFLRLGVCVRRSRGSFRVKPSQTPVAV